MRAVPSLFLQAGALLGAAGLCALVSNALSGPSRRVAWMGRPAVPAAVSVDAPAQAPAAPTRPAEARPSVIPPKTAPKVVDPNPAQDSFPAEPSRPIREIDSRQAWTAFQSQVRFLDARRTGEYEEGHVAGAWTLSVWESDVDTRITTFEAYAKPASRDPLVLYCSGGDCEDSHLLASKLLALGYRNLLIYRDGFPDWQKQGRPTEKGDKR